MTESEKQQWRHDKAEAVDKLRRSYDLTDPVQKAAMVDADERIGRYVAAIVEEPEKHNLYEVLAVVRFITMLHKYTWNATRVLHFFKFYERLRFSGLDGRRRYKLTPVQCFQYANIFGFEDAEERRLCRIAYIFVPRKFSKTTSTAAVAVYDMFFGDNNAQTYIGANSYEQAKICFDEIRNIIKDLDPQERHFRTTREKITYRSGDRESLIRCLTANARTQDGLNASLVIMDEYAQARNTAGKNGADLRNVLTSSMGARREPLTMIITTASDVVDGPFAHELEGVERVLRGEAENDSIFASLFMPDCDDKEDDPATWSKVQPHMGITIQPDFYRKEYANATLSAENMLAFRTKLLNVFAVNEATAWISAEEARAASHQLKVNEIKGRPDAMVSIDLSESNDFSAVSAGIYAPSEKNFYFFTAYFFPEEALAGFPNEKLYRLWAEQGHLILTQGKVIDYRKIVDYVLWLNKYFRILNIGYDQWKAQECVNMLAAAGAAPVLKPVRQTYGTFTAPVESFEHGLKTGHIFVDDNPINYYCFGNAILDYDRLDNCKPIKRSMTQKIDGVITMLMSLRLFLDYMR